ncbi:unnamed protein product [Arctia plantaginis]|uniref:Uncharacterized protein n=1 Tax=Arctia plantaginis TaxID=874455 RepID=A0A8S1AK63_ARCPL|nr:unnamed protein product [Arctia plantaginis]CAB3249300.1 unnamed protein product [Arctia plantaginis]
MKGTSLHWSELSEAVAQFGIDLIWGVSVEAVGCIERCVRSHAACCHLARSGAAAALVSRLPTYTAYKSCVLFDYATRLCGPLFILDLMPL